ncbi:sigma-E processing peptidase SpoIIGA [Dehalobacter sp. DCM]|uniref:sigma-E processing peptidase SpoIIGA n=1 Tax=Dehalobacter sp. DCM TaxID=2907827 RepID=UPI0030815DD4|nr:sigma-E processing peptidase SpoIIGA [Dehalobacter sp. DCM]
MYYLDVILFLNGAMDAFLLYFTAYLLRKKVYKLSVFGAVLIGELPVVFILYEMNAVIAISRIMIPILMVAVAFRTKSIYELAKGLLYFSLLAAVSGGIYYLLAGWIGITGSTTGLLLCDIWILPVIAILLVGGYRVWEKLTKRNLYLDNVLYDVELMMENGKKLTIKALLDTGNELRDPLTNTPVMILEEKAVSEILPEEIQQFLNLPWRNEANPWPFIWNSDESVIRKMVFIAAKGINGQVWLPGIRLGTVKITQHDTCWEQSMTAALVQQRLNTEGKYQALLHPENIQKTNGREEIA